MPKIISRIFRKFLNVYIENKSLKLAKQIFIFQFSQLFCQNPTFEHSGRHGFRPCLPASTRLPGSPKRRFAIICSSFFKNPAGICCSGGKYRRRYDIQRSSAASLIKSARSQCGAREGHVWPDYTLVLTRKYCRGICPSKNAFPTMAPAQPMAVSSSRSATSRTPPLATSSRSGNFCRISW